MTLELPHNTLLHRHVIETVFVLQKMLGQTIKRKTLAKTSRLAPKYTLQVVPAAICQAFKCIRC